MPFIFDFDSVTPMGFVICLLASAIWGMAFVAQSVSFDIVGPWTFNGIRFFIGFLVLVPLVIKRKDKIRSSIKGGCFCALAITLACVIQQAGIGLLPTGKAGFITSLYMVLVPFFAVVTGKKVTGKNWFCVLCALFGLFLLCGASLDGFGKGEMLMSLCACFFALQILLVDHFQEADPLVLSAFQFLFASLICLPVGCALEHPDFSALYSAAIPILYTGIMSTGVAYTLQAVGQRMIGPSLAVIPLSMESVFSALFGLMMLGQRLRPVEVFGCAVVFFAVILSQIDPKKLVKQ